MKKIKYDKEFKTFEEQILYLKTKYNLTIQDESSTLNLLKNFPYYNLINGYKEYFMKEEKYLNTSFEDLIFIHLLDKDFLTIIFEYSTYVEDIFKHKLAYIISSQSYNHVDEKIYLKDENLFKKDFESNIINKLENILNNTNEKPTKHYKEKHNHIPAWILFKNSNFNDITEFFKILNINLQIDVIKMFNFFSKIKFKFNTKPKKGVKNAKQIEMFKKSLVTIRKFRNLIGHNLKVFTYKLKNGISMYRFDDEFIKKFFIVSNKNHSGDLYTCIISIILLLDVPLSILFVKHLQSIIERHIQYSSMYFQMYKLPLNFNEILEELKDELIKINQSNI
ncbi:Abi family protein [Streptobacillus ratti]|uniref:Abi family protein n=1 Tax=Streptobacillus ratti TaxID=1720557 RepID=UPI000934004A|nr:Abi family protein [Streptobacillus ratti]